MKNWFRILGILGIFVTAALTIVTLEIYLNFYLPDYSTFAGIMAGIFLGAISARYLVRKHMKKNFSVIQSQLEKEITKLADEKRSACVRSAKYLTENYSLQRELKELKEFRDEVAKSIKELAGKMGEYLKEEPPAVIHIKGNEIELGPMMDNTVKKMAV